MTFANSGLRGRLRARAVVLVLPLLLFLAGTWLVPLAGVLFHSVDNSVFSQYMPRSAKALLRWDRAGIPGDETFAVLAEELKEAYSNRTVGRVANHLNHQMSGMRSLLIRTARRLSKGEPAPYRAAMLKVDRRWGEYEVWSVLRTAAPAVTAGHYLAALDLRFTGAGRIAAQPEDQAIYVKIFWRTLWVSLIVALICLLLGFPIAHLMANLPLRLSNWLMILVLLPFWTSLLVRTVSWIVLLQSSGVINSLMVWSGVIDDSRRVQLVFNLTGTIIVMSYVLLPFMVLPLYSVMKTIPKSVMQVAISLGAGPVRAFWRAYLPQVLPGIGAGGLLVFMLAVGYYITPALVGGQSGQLISNFIAYHIKTSLNWGMAAALGVILLAFVLLFYWLYNRFIGIDKMKVA